MTRTILGPSGSRRRWWSLATALMAVAAFAIVFVAGSGATSTTTATAPKTCTAVPAGSTNTLDANSVNGGYSNFEIDAVNVGGTAKKPVNTLGANLTLDGSSPCLDWTTKAAGAGTGIPADRTSGVLVDADKPTGSGDDSFTQGTSENDTTPTIASGSIPPNKSDLKQFGIYKESNSTGKFLNLFWSRVNAPSGTVDMDFELNKLACATDGTGTNCESNGVTPLRSNGDRLITYDLASGGTVPTISIYTWNGTATSGSWGTQQVISGATGEALGSINWSSINSNDSGGLGAQDPLTFGEVSISYKAIFGSGGTSGCGTFGSVYLKSRSSNTFTDELKDFVAPENVQITNCATLTTNASNQSTAQTLSATNTISDTATLSGASGATGTVVFTAYGPFDANSAASGDTCTATTQAFTDGTAGVTLTGPDASGNYSATDSFVPTSAGRYEWIASYGGDPNNIASPTGCKDANEFSLVKETPGVTTTLSASALNPGQTAHDGATLSWTSTPIPTGTVTYTIYSENTCATAATTGTGGMISAQPGSKTVNADGSVPNSDDVTFNLNGTYYWQASYSGDANYAAKKSACTSEQLVVNQLNSTISTAQSWTPQDTATIDHSGGSVVFTLYKNDNTCSVANDIAYGPTGSINVTGQGAGGTAPFQASTSNNTFKVTATAASPGDSYYWKAAYTSGDTNHKNVTSCVEVTTLTLANGNSVVSP